MYKMGYFGLKTPFRLSQDVKLFNDVIVSLNFEFINWIHGLERKFVSLATACRLVRQHAREVNRVAFVALLEKEDLQTFRKEWGLGINIRAQRGGGGYLET